MQFAGIPRQRVKGVFYSDENQFRISSQDAVQEESTMATKAKQQGIICFRWVTVLPKMFSILSVHLNKRPKLALQNFQNG